jgi:hypothetical protein
MTQKGNEMAAVEPNLKEVTVDALVQAEAERMREEAESKITEEARQIVEARLAAEAQAKREKDDMEAREKMLAARVKDRKAALKEFCGKLSKYMIDNDIEDTISIQRNTIRQMKLESGLVQ